MNTNLRKLPDFTQLDLFHADFNDVAIRALREVMERPFFSLSNNKPRFEPIIYKTNSAEVIITAGKPYGIATVFDHDILIWLVSQVVEARDKGEPTSPQIFFTPYDCLRGMYRRTNGHYYQLLGRAIERLGATFISTNIRKKDQIPLSLKERSRLKAGFHWLESYGMQTVKKKGKDVPQGITAVLPNWLYQGALKQGSVLTIDERYFLIRSGLERVLYMIARKHVGRQQQWTFTMRELYEKTGSESRFSDFVVKIRKIVVRDLLPEYCMDIYRGQHDDEVVIFSNRCKLAFDDPRYESPRLDKRTQRLRIGLLPDEADEARLKLYARRGIDLQENAVKFLAEHDVDNS